MKKKTHFTLLSHKTFTYSILLWILCFHILNVSAQNEPRFYNDWINHDQSYHKIKVINDGLQRINYTVLNEAGLPSELAGYQVFNKGKEVAIYISDADQNGNLDEGDYIEFFGQKNDGELDALLYAQKNWQLRPEQSLFGDVAIYYLTWKNTDVESHLRYQVTPNIIDNPPAKENFFTYQSSLFLDSDFYEGIPIRLGTGTHYSEFEAGEGFTNITLLNAINRTYEVPTPSIYTGNDGGAVFVATKLIAATNNPSFLNDHHLQIKINDNVLLNEEFDGDQLKSYNLPTTINNLTSPTSPINFESLDNGLDQNRHRIASVSITYPHSFDFNGQKSQLFELFNDADKYLEITNFKGDLKPILYDLTNHLRIEPTIEQVGFNENVYKFFLKKENAGGIKRQLYFINTTAFNEAVFAVEKLEKATFTNFAALENQGNYLIITHPHLLQGAVNQIQRYADYRATNDGGGYQPMIVNIEELYDQFAWGTGKHPLSIKHFIDFANENWEIKPEYLLLIGKSIVYSTIRFNPEKYDACLVPSFGQKAADILLSVIDSKYTPTVATGRIPASDPEGVRAYLDKVIDYEALRLRPSCDRRERLWMKDALHIAGGADLGEADSFIETLKGYEKTYTDSIFAGRVVKTYNKITEEAVENVDLGALLNDGLAVINFVGHSTGAYWGVDISNPYDYENYGRYPFIMASSCFVGDIHQLREEEETAMAEEYILADSLGAIGFLATVNLGFPKYLDIYMKEVYGNFCKNTYNKPVGLAINKGIEKIENTYGNLDPNTDDFKANKLTVQQFTLAGDPAIIINSFERPEYLIEENENFADVSLLPQMITTDLDSFTVQIIVTNLGRAMMDSMTVKIDRTLPDGTTQVAANQRIPAVIYRDTLSIKVAVREDQEVAGSNQLTVTIDAENDFEEDCEDNNSVNKEMFVFSSQLTPVAPCNFAIVSDPNPTLFASTGQPLLKELEYILQIDTTTAFNSGLLKEKTVFSKGGVIQWKSDVNLVDNTVYYWRTASKATALGEEISWQNSSFIFLKEGQTGWNQSHFYQLESNDLEKEAAYTSPNIGGALAWKQLEWTPNFLTNSALVIYGVKVDGSVDSLTATQNSELDLSFIDAKAYPFLKLSLKDDDVSNAFPLESWKVYFERFPEVALDQQAAFNLAKDTLDEGERLQVEFAITNVESTNIDSVLVHYSVIDPNGTTTLLLATYENSIAAGATNILNFDYETLGLVGENILKVEVNPVLANGQTAQPEKFRFNNIMFLPFYVLKDQVNPYVDITFDGQHILDGELVSARPEIRIKIQDNNRYLALNDTADFSLSLMRPDETGEPATTESIPLSHNDIQFIPAAENAAAEGKNIAEIVFNPDLTSFDGTYQITINAKDRSSNHFANNLYQISFKVINRSSISNVLNYPNPFTSSTQFLFKLTGSAVPEFFKIQIMTISGKVVREITQAELGEIHIGDNLTDFAWDGTDEFGNELANGLYLYRIVTRLNGQDMDRFHISEQTDNIFSGNLGKMYLMR